MSNNYFNDKKSEQKFMRLYNISEYDFYESEKYIHAKIHHRYLCWKYLPNIRDRVITNVAQNSKYEAVIIECRSFPHIEFIIRNAIIKLGDEWCHSVVCGNQNHEYMTQICHSISPNIRIIKLDVDNLDPYVSYNELLTSEYFWNLFSSEKILIYQEDSCIFKTNINDFTEFDYIGAPWDHELEWVKQSGLKIAAGNGGFSLRTRKLMLDIIKRYPRTSNELEDVYFSRTIQDHYIGTFPSVYQAYEFSSEGIVNRNSYGGHCHFNYDDFSVERFVRECVLTLYK